MESDGKGPDEKKRDIKERNKKRALNLPTEAGNMDGLKDRQKVIISAYVRDCSEDCAIRKLCEEEYVPDRGKCALELNFLSGIYFNWTDHRSGIGDVMSQDQLNRLGTHILPLHAMQIKLLKEFWALNRVTYEDNKGVKRINPILKEYRETLKSLGYEIKEAGLAKTWEEKYGNKGLPGGPSPTDKFGNVTRYSDMPKPKKPKKGEKDEKD